MTGEFAKAAKGHRALFGHYLNPASMSENECSGRLADEGGGLGRLILAIDAVHHWGPVGNKARLTVQTASEC